MISKFTPRLVVISVIVLVFNLSGYSQHSLKGRVTDDKNEPLSYATVAMLNPADSILKFFGVTNLEGKYLIKNINEGEYLMQYSFVGMVTIYEKITIPSGKEGDLGDKMMSPSSLDEVIVVGEYVPITFKSDTVVFNAKAFTTKSHAVVEDLLKKIPGIEVDEAGNMKALGEDVTRVLVDGKEFFGNDPKVATKNLPADAIDKVKVYDKKSEEAVFMGIDDGVRDRTIDLMLNEDHKKGYFGNLEAGAGTGEHYKVGAKIYRFSNHIQSALLGMYNNVNEFGYTGKNMENWGQNIKGLNKSVAGGLNLSYNTKGNNRYFISYLASSRNQDLVEIISTTNFIQNGSYQQVGDLFNDENNSPHRVNVGVRHNFNNNHNLTFDGNLNYTANDLHSQTFANTGLNDTIVNHLKNLTESNSNSFNAYGKAVYIAKLNKNITQFKTNFTTQYNSSASLLDWRDTVTFFFPDSMAYYYQYRDDNTDKLTLSADPTLVHRIRKFWYLSAGVGLVSAIENLNRKQDIFIQDVAITDYPTPDFYTRHHSLKPTISLKRNSNKSQVNLSLAATWNRFDKVLDGESVENPVYSFFLPSFLFEYKYRKGRRIVFRYNTSINMPSVNQLYPVVNTLNQLSAYQGNLDLIPEYNHNTLFTWWLFDQFSFTSLFARLYGGYTRDKFSISNTTNQELIQSVIPVNVPYYYSAGAHISFSTPIRTLGTKVSLRTGENWSKGISIINSEDNIQTNFSHFVYLTFENRNKEKWDAKIGGSVSITDAKFSIASLNTIYYNTTYFTKLRYTPGEKWSFETDANVVNYNSKSFDEAVSIPVIGASISYYFLKGERASVTLKGSDLLNKYIGFYRNSTTNYLIQQEWNTIGRYVMLTFQIRINK